MKVIFKRELHGYFCTLTGYAFIAAILLIGGVYTNVLILKNYYSNFEYVLGNMVIVYVAAIPILTMRVTAEDRRNNTDKLLYSAPVDLWQVAVGKYFAMIAVLLASCIFLSLYPVILSFFGKIHLAAAISALVGFWGLGAALLALGMFLSTLTDSPIASALLGFFVILLLYLTSRIIDTLATSAMASYCVLSAFGLVAGGLVWLMARKLWPAIEVTVLLEGCALAIFLFRPQTLEDLLSKMIRQFSLFEKFTAFQEGIFDLTALVFDAAVSAVLVLLTALVLENRRRL